MMTWMQVMAEVRRLDQQRRHEGRISGADAERLVTMLLEFHSQALETPSGKMPPPDEGAGS